MKLDDNSPMPIGVHKGEKMEDVPCCDLLWFYTASKNGELEYESAATRAIAEYVEGDLENIEKIAGMRK